MEKAITSEEILALPDPTLLSKDQLESEFFAKLRNASEENLEIAGKKAHGARNALNWLQQAYARNDGYFERFMQNGLNLEVLNTMPSKEVAEWKLMDMFFRQYAKEYGNDPERLEAEDKRMTFVKYAAYDTIFFRYKASGDPMKSFRASHMPYTFAHDSPPEIKFIENAEFQSNTMGVLHRLPLETVLKHKDELQKILADLGLKNLVFGSSDSGKLEFHQRVKQLFPQSIKGDGQQAAER